MPVYIIMAKSSIDANSAIDYILNRGIINVICIKTNGDVVLLTSDIIILIGAAACLDIGEFRELATYFASNRSRSVPIIYKNWQIYCTQMSKVLTNYNKYNNDNKNNHGNRDTSNTQHSITDTYNKKCHGRYIPGSMLDIPGAVIINRYQSDEGHSTHNIIHTLYSLINAYVYAYTQTETPAHTDHTNMRHTIPRTVHGNVLIEYGTYTKKIGQPDTASTTNQTICYISGDNLKIENDLSEGKEYISLSIRIDTNTSSAFIPKSR